MKNSEALERLKIALMAIDKSDRDRYDFRNEFAEALRVAIAALETMTPDWETAPEWAEWWAVDEDGAAYWYDVEPRMVKSMWWAAGAKDMLQPFTNWRESLEQRPKNEKP